jgi:hypothetical protein
MARPQVADGGDALQLWGEAANILREVGWDGRDWIDLAQDRDRWRA